MMKIENLEHALEVLGERASEKREAIREMIEAGVPEKEFVEKLGIDDEKLVKRFLRILHDLEEKDVFSQELSKEELAQVAGGASLEETPCLQSFNRYLYKGCDSNWARPIDIPKFPNCAATVEDGSFCWSADACFEQAVMYGPMRNCTKAWK